ncbi:MAG TPA: hypothetical protein VNK06_05145, partial [Thermodesulfobacteriota bacterium]|nr:hypothetical protein [Thermodesulfobacteriota bacterium]
TRRAVKVRFYPVRVPSLFYSPTRADSAAPRKALRSGPPFLKNAVRPDSFRRYLNWEIIN